MSKKNDSGILYKTIYNDFQSKIVDFCRKPRTKAVLAKEFGFDEHHPSYFINNYVMPLIAEGKLRYTIPEKPKSKNQQIVVT